MTKRLALFALGLVVFAGPAVAQTPVRFPHSLVISRATVQAAMQAPAGTAAQSPSNAAQPGAHMPLTLDEAVKLALDHNLDISVQRLNRATYDVALASVESVYNPTINSTISNASAKQAGTNTISGATAVGQTISTETAQFNAGLSQNVRWHGGSYGLTFNNTRQSTTSQNALYNPQYNGLLVAQYTQPMLRNFSTDSNRQQLLVTKINQEISDLQVQQTVTNTVANTRNAYWDYVFAVQSVDVARQVLNLAEELVKNNQLKVQIGTLAPIDVVQAQSQAAAQRQALVTAEGTARTAEIALKRLIVSGTSDPLWSATIDPVDRPEFTPQAVDLNAAIQSALSKRTDVLQAKKNLEANNLTLDLLQNQTLPEADLVARYQTSGVGGTQFLTTGNGVNREVIGTVPGGYLDALTTLFHQKLPTWSFAINFSYPLGMSATQAAVSRAKIQQNQVDVQLRQIDLQVATDVSNAVVSVQNAIERVQAAQAARDLAQQQLNAENSKYGVGMSTQYNLVQAQRDLSTAQNNELQAILAYRRALVEFDRVQQTGSAGNITVIGGGGGGGGGASTSSTSSVSSGGTGSGGR